MARSTMSRTTDLGESSASETHGFECLYVTNAGSSRSARGLGHVMVSSSAMRSSYSYPSAFMAATASPRARCCCATSTWRGSDSVASRTETTSSACVGDSTSSRSSAASAKGDNGWLSANSRGRSTVRRTVGRCPLGYVGSGTRTRSTMPATRSDR
ncbi:hypothetical protein D3C74_314130 [compost metagenome]